MHTYIHKSLFTFWKRIDFLISFAVILGTNELRASAVQQECVKFAGCEAKTMILFVRIVSLVAATFLVGAATSGQAPSTYPATEGEYVAHNFKFKSGETLPELRLHYRTLGKPDRDAEGRVKNAVLILHGTGGSGQQDG